MTKKIRTIAAFALIITGLLFTGVAFADPQAVNVATKDTIGRYLTDVSGFTLYTFKKDTPGKSACEGDCVAKWPLYYQEEVEGHDGLVASDFGTIARPDGNMQSTYKGLPLYYFDKDTQPGDTLGHGVKGVWNVAKP